MRSVNHRHWGGVVLKRMMLKAAAEIARDYNASGLVMGDAVAQVSSQTLTNLNVVDRASDEVVLRPLIAMDKQEIIRIAKDIGTEPFARNMPEYCGVISSKPVTRARLHRVEEEEANMDRPPWPMPSLTVPTPWSASSWTAPRRRKRWS